MITKAYIRRRKTGAFVVSTTPGGEPHWAKWKLITSRLWDRVSARQPAEDFPGPSVLEKRAWRFLLKDSSLLKNFRGTIRGPEGFLTKKAFNHILNITPPALPGLLIRPALESVRIPPEEEAQIKFECHTLWSGRGSVIKAPHPLLEEAVECMSMTERYGISHYKCIGEIPQRTLVAMRLISATYSDLMEMNAQSRELQEKAARAAGLRGSGQYLEPN